MTDFSWIPSPLLNGMALGVLTPSGGVRNLAARTASVLSQTRRVELVDCDLVQNFVGVWSDLAARALEPNVFAEPSFALAAAQHLPGGAKPQFLLAWEVDETQSRGRLLGLWPMIFPHGVFGSLIRSWKHAFNGSCAPLLDRALAFVVLDEMIAWLNQRRPDFLELVAPLLAKNGADYRVLRDHAQNRGLPIDIISQHDRAALDATAVGVGAGDFISPKKKKELQRQFRRLREMGSVSFGMAREGAALRDQVEAFMALEARGWKGRRGTAFLCDPGQATFLRVMTRALGREDKCRVYSLSFEGRMIAGGIVLIGDGGTAYFWKTAYDEEFSFASPGVLLTMDMTDRLLRETKIHLADSCAMPDHPMIDHIWRGRLRMADVMMSLRENRPRAFNGALHREQFRLRLREKAKNALARFRTA